VLETGKPEMSKQGRIAKTVQQEVTDLDAHLFLLREHLHRLATDVNHLKVISAELRTLVCFSSGTEGLLWRLTEELRVDDRIFLHVPGQLQRDHPLARDLKFLIIPIQRGGKGDPRLRPSLHSLQEIIKRAEALVAAGEPITHEQLIKMVAQQMGTAHEAASIEPALVELKSILVGGVEPLVPVLATDAELVLEIGERVLDTAEERIGFSRPAHSQNYGDLSVVTRIRSKQLIIGRLPIFRLHSYVSDVDVRIAVGPGGIAFLLRKGSDEAVELLAPYPKNWQRGSDAVFVLSYCSRTRQARTITNAEASPVRSCDIGWVHAPELVVEEIGPRQLDLLEKQFLLTYKRLLSPQDAEGLSELPPDGYGLWKFRDELEDEGPFPG
jgi:hypothetical protein